MIATKSQSTSSLDVAGSRRRMALTASALVALLVALAVSAGSAWAGEVHVPTGTIGEPGSGNGKLSLAEHSGIAVNITTGDIYVSDTGNHRVEEFEPGGTFVRTFAPTGDPGFTPTSIAIDNSGGAAAGDVYVADSSTNSVFKFESDGTQISEWVPKSGGGFEGKLTFIKVLEIATGPDGELWVDSEPTAELPVIATYRRYEPSGVLVAHWESGQADIGLAVDREGNLYKSSVAGGVGATKVGRSSGEELGQRLLSSPLAIGTDPETGDLYIVGREEQVLVRSYSPTCGTVCTAPAALDEFGRHELSNPQGIAVGPGHVVYLADAGTSTIEVYGVETVEPPTIVGPLEITDITGNTAHVSGVIDPHAPAGEPSTYEVDWYLQCLPIPKEGEEVGEIGFRCGHLENQEGTLPADSAEHTVEGTATVFSPLTEYEVRLVAVNRGGRSVASAKLTTTALPPSVEEVFATGVSTTGATLNAGGLNPEGAEVDYYFEYATEAEGLGGPGAHVTPTDTLPAGIVGERASTAVTGLEPNTRYVYRLYASGQGGSVQSVEGAFSTQGPSLLPGGECSNESFRAFAGAALPDCRAYELASPVDKAGLNIEGFAGLFRAASDSEGEEPGITFYSQAGSGIPAGGGARQELVSMLASRVGEAWSTQRLLPPESLGQFASYLGSSSNLRYALVTASFSRAANGSKLFRVDTSTGAIVEVAEAPSPATPLSNFAADAIADNGSSVLFESKVPLSTAVAGAAGKSNLYRWDAADGEVSLVGVRPTAQGEKEKSFPKGSFGGAYAWKSKNVNAGGTLAGLYVEAVHAATSDGEQIYLTAGETGQIYLRRGLTGAHPSTLQVSKPAADAPSGEKEHPAAFQEATPNGSYAFFTSAEKLTGDATTGAADEGNDLYRFDEATEGLVDITPDQAEEASGGARVQGLLGASSDGTSGYFAAKGDLATGATAGQNNIYRFQEEAGGGFEITYVATVGEGTDELNWSPSSYSGTVIANFEGKSARVSADGNTLIFVSRKPITSYDNHGCGYSETESCNEIFRFAAASREVTCVSCDPTGARPIGDAELSTELINSHLIPNVAPAPILTRNLSADGNRVFFETPDPLVSADTNGSPSCVFMVHANGLRSGPRCMDVYEWEAPDAPGGSCAKAEINGGCVYLLSTGKSDDPSYFLDASAEGNDVFIATTSQLVPVDKDENYDAYNVRINGGLGWQQAVPGTPCTSGEACHGSAASPPTPSTVGSSTFQGPGNTKATTPKKCKKGSVRKQGKCVKKKQAKKSKKKKHHSSASKGGRK